MPRISGEARIQRRSTKRSGTSPSGTCQLIGISVGAICCDNFKKPLTTPTRTGPRCVLEPGIQLRPPGDQMPHHEKSCSLLIPTALFREKSESRPQDQGSRSWEFQRAQLSTNHVERDGYSAPCPLSVLTVSSEEQVQRAIATLVPGHPTYRQLISRKNRVHHRWFFFGTATAHHRRLHCESRDRARLSKFCGRT